MDYAGSLRDVLIRKINKTERDLAQLKLDYCRFVYGLSHRSKVFYEGHVYQIKSVDLESMKRNEQGEWSKPNVSGVLLSNEAMTAQGDLISIGDNWELVA